MSFKTRNFARSFSFGYTIFFVVLIFDWVQTQTLVSNGKDRGTWGRVDKCPMGSFVTGMRLKIEKYEGEGVDDTGLNGVKFYCTKPWSTNTTTVESEVGVYGVWETAIFCPAFTFASAFELKVETEDDLKREKSEKDQIGAQNLKLICASPLKTLSTSQNVPIEGQGVTGAESWGRWDTERQCNSGHFICSIQTQVEPALSQNDEGNFDDSSLNNIKVTCCKIDL